MASDILKTNSVYGKRIQIFFLSYNIKKYDEVNLLVNCNSKDSRSRTVYSLYERGRSYILTLCFIYADCLSSIVTYWFFFVKSNTNWINSLFKDDQYLF